MSKTESMRPDTPRIPDVETALGVDRATKARAAMELMRKRARDAAEQARIRARGEISRRRVEAADRLENLAGVLRSQDKKAIARVRRRTAVVASGSTLALTAAIGVGVALGMLMSRQKIKRAAISSGGDRAALPGGVDNPDLVNAGGLRH
jgi:hypothetical protein